ncbi:hypothetical protein C1G86_1129 [Dehalococcoides mccartyi]|uniref:Uncharacterized protein n=1 Tax=Dehalococcoides mccartyi TaxID=61435 RepID=A0A142VAT9_9CHLR|nr:hypothetical protein Dm11a5_1066 [Dehalococcoides mccartyi]AOV99682.1 hypothetical protein DCWBC2_1057 [Dehalococcoides mccartyi]RAL69118.1 hypothetical protein C1G87_1093 [Dehalococcoides mccartyi]RAL70254.1 hypothetical protein C1G86_1129 [Dehalococcoides mccartyi]
MSVALTMFFLFIKSYYILYQLFSVKTIFSAMHCRANNVIVLNNIGKIHGFWFVPVSASANIS